MASSTGRRKRTDLERAPFGYDSGASGAEGAAGRESEGGLEASLWREDGGGGHGRGVA